MRQICRDAAPLPVTAREVEPEPSSELPEELLSALRGAVLPDTLAAFGRLFWGTDGRLWVQRDRPSSFTPSYLGVPGARYDVFDAEGRYLGGVSAPPGAYLQAAAGDTVWSIEFGQLDEASVVAYELVVD